MPAVRAGDLRVEISAIIGKLHVGDGEGGIGGGGDHPKKDRKPVAEPVKLDRLGAKNWSVSGRAKTNQITVLGPN